MRGLAVVPVRSLPPLDRHGNGFRTRALHIRTTWLGFGVWGSVRLASVLEEWAFAHKNVKQRCCQSAFGFGVWGWGLGFRVWKIGVWGLRLGVWPKPQTTGPMRTI